MRKWDKRMDQFQAVIEMFSAKIDEVSELKTRVAQLSERVKALEKLPRQSNEHQRDVIISNVPPLENEDTLKLVGTIFKSLQSDLKDGDVLRATRFESKNTDNKRYFLKVKLVSDQAKGSVIKAARAARATLSDLQIKQKTGVSFENEQTLPKEFLNAPIYINEATFRETRTILNAAIRLKREKKLHAVWTYFDKVYVRKEQKSSPVGICNEEDLRQF